MRKVRIFQAVALLVFLVLGFVFFIQAAVEGKRLEHQKLLESRQQAQMIAPDSKWVLSFVAGPIGMETYLFNIVEVSTGHIASFEIWLKDPAWNTPQLGTGSQFKLKFEERQNILAHVPTLAGYLIPVEITPPRWRKFIRSVVKQWEPDQLLLNLVVSRATRIEPIKPQSPA